MTSERVKIKLAETTPFVQTPLKGYWGGKTMLAKYITPLIDSVPHRCYVEPFFGGGAVFFARRIPRVQEVLNDADRRVYTFWRQVMLAADDLPSRVINHPPNSHAELLEQQKILAAPDDYSPADVALAVIYTTTYVFSGNWQRDAISVNVGKYSRLHSTRMLPRRADLLRAAFWRMRQAQFLQRDALKLIGEFRDDEEVLFYIDPPYVGSGADQGSYEGAGWGADKFDALLNTLGGCACKFVLSEYPSEALDSAVRKNGWHTRVMDVRLLSSSKTKGGGFTNKREVLVWNYDAPHYSDEGYTLGDETPLFARGEGVI